MDEKKLSKRAKFTFKLMMGFEDSSRIEFIERSSL